MSALAEAVARLAPDLPAQRPGEVWRAGAGPGRAGRLTLEPAALAQAEAGVHDALVDPAELRGGAPGAELCPVGKRRGRASTPQGEIDALLAHLARQGLRLKGGGPCVFGRGPAAPSADRAAPVVRTARGPSSLAAGRGAVSGVPREADAVSPGASKDRLLSSEDRAFCAEPEARSERKGLVARRSPSRLARRSGRREASGRCGRGGVRSVPLSEARAGSFLRLEPGSRRGTGLALSGSDRPRGWRRPVYACARLECLRPQGSETPCRVETGFGRGRGRGGVR